MALHIEDPEADWLAHELAAATGESITVATRQAIAERLARVHARTLIEPQNDELRALIARGRVRPMLDQRDDTILGYDEVGSPT